MVQQLSYVYDNFLIDTILTLASRWQRLFEPKYFLVEPQFENGVTMQRHSAMYFHI